MLTRSIVLIGLTGSGKTTVGKRLAKQLNCAFVDTDHVVFETTGLSVREIFEQQGEPVFRGYEARALEMIFAETTPKVIAAAGGVVLAERNRDVIRNSKSFVVWLDTEPSILLKRVSVGVHRPLLDDDAPAALMAMNVTRRDLYAELADVRVDTNERDINGVVKNVLEHIATQGTL
ncbi:MAG: shikimate kinase [Ilumatobacteraceae bacterium]